MKIEESKSFVAQQIIKDIEKGNFRKRRKKSYDNVELIPKNPNLMKQNKKNNLKLTGARSMS